MFRLPLHHVPRPRVPTLFPRPLSLPHFPTRLPFPFPFPFPTGIPPARPPFRTIHFPNRTPPPTRYKRFSGPPKPPPSGRPFGRLRSLPQIWHKFPAFRYTSYTIISLVLLTYLTNLERVPVSGRLRFNIISPRMETYLAQQMYQEVLSQYRHKILSFGPAVTDVSKIMDRLISVSGITDIPREQWKVHVIDDPRQKNAFVLPGGKVFVFSGIINLAQTRDALAAVLGHELAHLLAHHTGERISQQSIVTGFILLGQIALTIATGWVSHAGLGRTVMELAYLRPSSRKQEAEADYIGLMMMAKACFDPEEAVRLWERMETAEKIGVPAERKMIQLPTGEVVVVTTPRDGDGARGGGEIPQFLSTHPAHRTRIEKLKEWLPQAIELQQQSDCWETTEYIQQFRKQSP